MKVHLMFTDADFDQTLQEPDHSDDLVQDLQLGYLISAMADGDDYLAKVARSVLLHPLVESAEIVYRQNAFSDCAANLPDITQLYQLSIGALTVERGIFMMPIHDRPELTLQRDTRMLTALADILDTVHELATTRSAGYRSNAFRAFFEMIASELSDAYMAELRGTVTELELAGGLLFSAGIGPDATVTSEILRRPRVENKRWLSTTPLKRPNFSFTIPERDEAGFSALSDLRDRTLNEVSSAASQAVDHVLAFFGQVRSELAFYLGCANLHHALTDLGADLCTPRVAEDRTPVMVAEGLYDPCLALRAGTRPQVNDIDTAGNLLTIITGANHGGKSTFLRASGVAQLMLQAGMFAPATAFTATPARAFHTHWSREEDAELAHGKLDEELLRMSEIVSALRPGDVVLCNESFASTNEVEGSEIATQITRALVDAGVVVRFVTHLFDFATEIHDSNNPPATFLRANADTTGKRTYVLEQAGPLPSANAMDVFTRIFGTDQQALAPSQPTQGSRA
jgi:hypothetical protein